jgi:uncharacterized damage-inducible protein DinB
MTGDLLLQQFDINRRTVSLNLEAVSQEDSVIQPPPGGNCINWVVGHILASRNPVHRLLGLPPAWADDEAARYDRGSAPVTDASQAVDLETMTGLLEASQEALAGAMGAMADEDLGRTAGDKPLGVQLAFLSFHESYHAGQLGVLRRLTGHPGAIS